MYDRHVLYEIAVQRPEMMTGFIEAAFRTLGRGKPRVFREDFCGTANLAATWVRSGADRRAVGVDNDAAILRYAQRYNRATLGGAASRLKLIRGDVVKCRAKADVLVSLNFSHFIYKSRGELLAYFRHARRCVNPGGLFICDAYGGPGAMEPCRDERKFGDFTYVWEQVSYDPRTADVLNHIHFRLPGRKTIRKAFTYDWRLWSLPELSELLVEAGFKEPRICFETEHGYDERFDPAKADAWVAYLVASRSGVQGSRVQSSKCPRPH